MKRFFRRLLILIIGLLCLVVPFYLRSTILGYNQRSYKPPAIDAFTIAATPAPTPTAVAMNQPSSQSTQALRRGPVVIDLAHFNRLNPSSFQPLQAALAAQGIGSRFWLSKVDIGKLTGYLDFPDQSDALAEQLTDASGLIVISPFFLWSKAEIALVEKFVANGGRLLLISDPDVQGDAAIVTNMLAEPFGVVFNDDYLYDTVANDENYTHFFQKTFTNQASSLTGSKIVFYGGRSISGAVTAQVQSAPTTLSSLRTGLSGFTTVAIGGQKANQSSERVLAMSDFDVLSEPYVTRFDNRRILDFAAAFLSDSHRDDTLVNFPAYLGQEIALIVDSSDGVNADLLQQGAQLQHQLEETGRSLTLAGTAILTETQLMSTGVASNTATDVIYITDFEAADKDTNLLHDIGIKLVKELTYPTPTPVTPTPKATPTSQSKATATPEARVLPTLTATTTVSSPELPTGTLAATVVGTATATPTRLSNTATPTPEVPRVAATTPTAQSTITPGATILQASALTATLEIIATPAPTPTPQVAFFLQTNDGLKLQAEQTLLIVQRQRTPQQRMVAVLAFDAKGVELGVARLLNGDLKDCMMRRDLAICPVATASKSTGKEKERTTLETPTPKASGTPTPSKEPSTPMADKSAILLIDDNAEAKADETSEADFYLQTLTKAGSNVKLWTTAKDGVPTLDDLAKYKWVIWSDAAYASSGIGTDKLQSISDYLGKGGRLLISSRLPFFGVGSKAASVIADVVVSDTTVSALVRNLPKDPIALPADLPPVVPLQVNDESGAPTIVLSRGPKSSDASAPVLLLMTDEQAPNSVGARLMILGMSITWLPAEVGGQLVTNMSDYMLKDQ